MEGGTPPRRARCAGGEQRAMTSRVGDHEFPGIETCLAKIDTTLTDLVEARAANALDEKCCPSAVAPLAQTVNLLVQRIQEIASFIEPVCRGDLLAPLPPPGNLLAAPLVDMHARLSRLTHQTRAIAHGDYSQRIDHMGDLSDAFNTMAALLEERERALVDEIARRKQAEDDLQRERDLLVGGPVVTVRRDAGDEGAVHYVSPNMSAFGFAPEDFTSGGRSYGSIVHPEDVGRINEDAADKARAGLESWVQEYRLVDAAGAAHWIRDFTYAVRDADGMVTAYEDYIIDVTPQKAAETALRQREEQLRMLSLLDTLTGLYNRRGLFALGEHALRVARRHGVGLGVIVVDIKGLKKINDRFGHTQGDAVLRQAADIIRGGVRESDVAGRIAGDEFVILVEDDGPVTEGVVRRLRRRAERASDASGRPFPLLLRIGGVTWQPGQPVDLQELIERAEQRACDERRAGRRTAASQEQRGSAARIPRLSAPDFRLSTPDSGWSTSRV